MKLELKHLGPYLPHRLRFSLSRSKDEFICTGLTVEDDGIMAHYNGGSVNVSLFKYYKPVLRPLSDLTKEIEHNTERLIPMVRLLEMGERHTFSKDDLIKRCSVNAPVNVIECGRETYSDTNIYQVTYALKTSNIGTLVYSFSYDDRFDRFSKRDETREITLGVGYQLHLFQKLFEWHFDVFGLIESNLAMDINSLNQKS